MWRGGVGNLWGFGAKEMDVVGNCRAGQDLCHGGRKGLTLLFFSPD